MPYAELHCLTCYSFLRGASHPRELVARAAQLGYAALAITDECSLAGIVKAHVAAKEHGIKLIVGSEFRLEEGIRLVALAPSRAAYSELSGLISLARRRSPKGEYRAALRDVVFHLKRCLIIWLAETRVETKAETEANTEAKTATKANAGCDDDSLRGWGQQLARLCRGRLWLGVSNLLGNDEAARLQCMYALARALDVPVVACGDVQMHEASRKPLHDVFTALRYNTSIERLGRRRLPNSQQHLRTVDRLQRLYPTELLAQTLHIAALCEFTLDELRYEYPEEVVPDGHGANSYLRELVAEGAARRWPRGVPPAIQARIDAELALIGELAYEYYFLTVYDIVRFARERGILCQGRGSAANSVVCYCLFITEVSPEQVSLLFERFISKERDEPPDIDVDFEHERREEVIQYIYGKYTRKRAALAATVITYRARSAVRDVGRALGLDAVFIDDLAKSLAWWDRTADLAKQFEAQGMASHDAGGPRKTGPGTTSSDAASLGAVGSGKADSGAVGGRGTGPGAVAPEVTGHNHLAALFHTLVQQILGFPRHLSQHVGGFVITRSPISTLVPVENASMPERTVIQWDKEDIEALGLLKVDVLALGMLSAIRKSLALVQRDHPAIYSVSDIPTDDAATWRLLQQADTVGVFQIESRAQMSMLPRLKPACFYDLVIQIAIVRPGPIQGNMVHPYLQRRQGLEPVTFPSEAIKDVLARTLGVPIFQEQVIRLAMVAAGFSGGEADALRRAIANWGRDSKLATFEQKLIRGMIARGYDEDFAHRLFAQIQGFAGYGFPESHSASFALLAWISAWLKCHHPAAFYTGLLNSQPMGFYTPSQLVQDARRHGVTVLPVDVNASGWDHQLLPAPDNGQPPIRLGLRLVQGLSRAGGERIVEARQQAAFRQLGELRRRAQLERSDLAALAQADALRSLSGHRHQAQWQIMALEPERPLLPDGHAPAGQLDDGIHLPPPAIAEEVLADYRAIGLTLRAHPMSLLRERPPFSRCKRHADLPALASGRFVRLAGLVTCRQRPGSAAGVLFLTLEDETGSSNVVVWRRTQQVFRQALMSARLLLVNGVVESRDGVIHVIAGALFDHSAALAQLRIGSRDFR